MKKILSLVIPILFFSGLAFGQTSTKFDMTIVAPANNATLTYGVAFNQEAYITITSGSVSPSDTFAWRDPATPTGQVNFKFVTATKNVNDTIRIDRTGLTLSNGSGNVTYCVSAFVLDGGTFAANFDTTGGDWAECVNVTLNFASSTGDFAVKQGGVQKLNIYPNPAVGNTINLDYVALNSGEAQARIVDLSGRTVLTHSFGKVLKGEEGFELDISALNKGMYIIELRQGDIKSTGRFIK